MLRFLDIFFLVFHTVWTAFNVVGWAWRRTRLWHLATITLTACSWFVLGIFYGFGYCLCTDWHWAVRRKLGYTGDPHSYVQFLVEQLTGYRPPRAWADTLAISIFFAAAALTVVLNARDWRRRRCRKIAATTAETPPDRSP